MIPNCAAAVVAAALLVPTVATAADPTIPATLEPTTSVALVLPAQAHRPLPTQSRVMGFTSDQIAAIGIGVVGGLVVFDGFFSAPPLLSALLGGLIGNWYYHTKQDEMIGAAYFHRYPSDFARHALAQAPSIEARWLQPLSDR